MFRSFKGVCCFFLPVLLSSHICIGQDSLVLKQLKKVQDASYVDSAKLFNLGERIIKEREKFNNDGIPAQVMIYYGNYFFYIRNLEKAEQYFNAALEYANSKKAYKVARLAQVRLSYLQFEYGNTEQSEKELRDFLNKAKASLDHENTAEILNLLGIIQESKGNTKEAARLYLEGLTLAELNNLGYYQAVSYNNLGLIKYSSGDLISAKNDFEKGLVISEKQQNERLSSHIQMNLCLVLTGQSKFTEAYRIFNRAIEYSRKNGLPLELSTNYVNLGSAMVRSGNEKIALAYYDSAIILLSSCKLYKQLNSALLGKINVLVQLKKIKEADELLDSTKSALSRLNMLEDWVSYHELKFSIYEAKGDYKNAFLEHMEYMRLKDSLGRSINIKIVEELQLKYRAQKKEVELEREKSRSLLLEKSNQEERFTKWLVIFSSFILLIIVYIVIYSGYNKKIREKQKQFSRQLIENIEEERQRISMDLQDDIGQSLSIIKAKVLNEKLRNIPPSAETENELTRVIQQTREISKRLYPSHLEKIGLVRSVAALFESIQQGLKLECSYEISNTVEELPINYKTHVLRIIQECTNNTIKHSGASGLKISMQEKNDVYQLIYQDNGNGVKGKKGNLGMGIFSMQERAKIINGTIEIDDRQSKGFRLILEFKSPTSES